MDTTVILLSHTHWDRQWYRTVQEFRVELVKMMDKLLELLEKKPEFKVFHLDGQTAMIEDYLEFRPEKEETIRSLVEAGRLKIGPWYLQPDNYIVSGEGLVRNLLKGTRYARRFGGYTAAGWLPDSFGHPQQMPQILAGFGIDNYIFSRGLGDHLDRDAIEFFWESPHGDRVVAIFQHSGYYGGGNLAYPFFWGDIQLIEPNHDLAVNKLSTLISESEKDSFSGIIPVWNGSDHMSPERSLPETVRYANEQLQGYRIVHGSVEEYLRQVKQYSEGFQTVRGELRGARHEAILASVLSSRIHIKLNNYRLERALERETEPLAVFAGLLGAGYPKYALDDAWDALIKNHFHDAICGCSIDQAHREMDCSFSKTDQTVRLLTNDSLNYIGCRLAPGRRSYRDHSVSLMVFNSIPQERNDVACTQIDVPYWDGSCKAVYEDGREVPLQILERETIKDLWIPFEASAGHIKKEIPWWQEYLRYIEYRVIADFSIDTHFERPQLNLWCGDTAMESETIIEAIIEALSEYSDETFFSIHASFLRLHALLPSFLPGFGYTSASILPAAGEPSRTSDFTGIQSSEGVLENRYLRLEVDGEGGVHLLHKESGTLYADVHRFQDQGDRGDTYDYCPVGTEDEENTVLRPARVTTRLEESGPVRGCIVVHQVFEIPESLHSENRDMRSTVSAELEVESRVYVTWEQPFAEFVTTVHNNVKDHRLRTYAQAPFSADYVYSDGQFGVQKRRSEVEPKPDWTVPPASVFPHDRWIALSDGDTGLAVFSEGLPEHNVVPGSEGSTIALTLLRCVGWLSRQDNATRPGQGAPPIPTPDAQCQGTYTFRYAIYPFTGEVEESSVVEAAQQFDAQPFVKQLRTLPEALPRRFSMLRLSPGFLQMTALKKSEDERYVCLRFYNPKQRSVSAHLQGDVSVQHVFRARADETPLSELPVTSADSGFAIELTAEAAEIVTLLIEPAPAAE